MTTPMTVPTRVAPTLVPSKLVEELAAVLDMALRVTGDKGNVQLFYPAECSLRIVAQSGFGREFLEFFAVTQEGQAACGTACLRRRRIIVEDVATDALFAGTEDREVLLRAGVRAVHSTPSVNPLGDVLGVLSCHYARPGRPSGVDLRYIDALAQDAVNIIERHAHFGRRLGESPKKPGNGSGCGYSIFCRTHSCVSFVEATSSRETALEWIRRLSARQPGEFVLFRNLNVLAVGERGLLKIPPQENL